MKYTLIFRLCGPMQAWGVSSRFSIRETLSEPSKSGILGLICAALGWERTAQVHEIDGQIYSMKDLAALDFGIRVLKEGKLEVDYHTAQDVLRANAKLKAGKEPSRSDVQSTVLSDRYYLSDAYFLAGLAGEDRHLLKCIGHSLQNPRWPLFLGRKAFVPSLPFTVKDESGEDLSLVDKSLLEALMVFKDPLFISPDKLIKGVDERVVLDGNISFSDSAYQLAYQTILPDVPISFSPRKFTTREVCTYIKKNDVSK